MPTNDFQVPDLAIQQVAHVSTAGRLWYGFASLCVLVMLTPGALGLWAWIVHSDKGAAGWMLLIFLSTAVVCGPLAILFWGLGMRAAARQWRA